MNRRLVFALLGTLLFVVFQSQFVFAQDGANKPPKPALNEDAPVPLRKPPLAKREGNPLDPNTFPTEDSKLPLKEPAKVDGGKTLSKAPGSNQDGTDPSVKKDDKPTPMTPAEREEKELGWTLGTKKDSKKSVTSEKVEVNTSMSAGSIWKIFGTLAVMIVFLVGGIWLLKKYMPGIKDFGGNSVIEVISRTAIGPKQSLQLIKLANKVILVGVSAERMDTLTEVDSREDIEILLTQKQASSAVSISNSFKSIFKTRTNEMSHFSESEEKKGKEEDTLRDELDRIKTRIANWKDTNTISS